MEEILLTIVIIVAIICYTIYKIDCNHVNKPTGGLSGHRSLEKPKKAKGTKIPPGSKTYSHKVPNEETLQAMFGKDYIVEKKPASDELIELLKNKAEENRKDSE